MKKLEPVKKLLKGVGAVLALCLGTGILVSKTEKNKGWIEGHEPYGFYEKAVKRSLDFGLSLFAVILLWSVMLVTAVLVKVKLGSPVLFKQERPGLGGKTFTLYKFRTMTDWRDENGEPLPDGDRLTPFGKRLREMSMDELPELFNIIKGDMSIVGPRPLLVEYIPLYSEKQRHRHDVRPGLTGLAQVLGRNELSWEEKFEDDVKYAERITFLGDLKIVVKTVIAVLGRKGISSKTCSTMEVFTGGEYE